MSEEFTSRELMIVSGSRELNDDDVGLIGVGLPLLAGRVAKRTHAPNLKAYVEIGLGEPSPIEDTLGIGDVRMFHNPVLTKSWSGVMMKILQRGDISVGFLGAIQVDKFGNVNTTLIGDPDDPKRRFTGSGGANDIATNADRFIVIIPLEERRFPETVDFVTSPGYISGPEAREALDLPGGGPEKVITDRAIFDFDDETKAMRLHSVHPGESVADIRESVGFDLVVPDDPPETKQPTETELEILDDIQ